MKVAGGHRSERLQELHRPKIQVQAVPKTKAAAGQKKEARANCGQQSESRWSRPVATPEGNSQWPAYGPPALLWFLATILLSRPLRRDRFLSDGPRCLFAVAE